MRVLVRLPNWLGDAVMATPALHELATAFPRADLVLVGTAPVVGLFSGDPRFAALEVDTTRRSMWRGQALWSFGRQLLRKYGPFDAAWALPNSVSSRWFLKATGALNRVGAAKGWRDLALTHAIRVPAAMHMVEYYHRLVTGYVGSTAQPGPLWLPVKAPRIYPRPTAGLNPGAAYGSAKRWEPVNFGRLGVALAKDYDLVIFGGPADREMASSVEQQLRERGVTNFKNLAGSTSVSDLVAAIAGLDLFLANDSGPLHMATALRIPTVAIFGPTNPDKSRPWLHPNAVVVRHPVECSPCMRRVCPLKHHACMRGLTVERVLEGVRAVERARSAVA